MIVNLHGKSSGQTKPVDLEIRVTAPWGRGERAFEFELGSPSGAVELYRVALVGPPIHAPDAFRKELLKQVACLSQGQDADGKKLPAEDRLAEMIAIGHDLYRKLFPRELREIFADVRGSVSTLLITSDEPWIPWEILHPAEDEDDDFLCMKFAMSRWLTAKASLAPRKHVGRILGLQAGAGAMLPSTAYEIGLLESLCQGESGARGVFPPSVTTQELSRYLEEESFDLIHFAGHSRGQQAARFGSACIALGDRSFRARNISPVAERKLRVSRPIVFLNSCHVSQIGHDLTELDGWAPHWVRQCRCSAVLGPSWAVDDSRALDFAQIFYDEIFAGKTLGEAVRGSRAALRQSAPDELTWLAYCLHGHPGAQISLGSPCSHEETATTSTDSTGGPPSITIRRRIGATSKIGLRAPLHRVRGVPLRPALLIVAVVLVVLSVVFWPRPERERPGGTQPPKNGITDTSAELPIDAETAETKRALHPGVGARSDQPAEPPEPVPVKTETPTLLPVEMGRVAIIAVDAATDGPARDIASAIRSVLGQQVKSIRPSVPQQTSALRSLLESRDPSLLPADGRAPWGAEFLLFARTSQRDLPQSSQNLIGVALTLETEILATQSGEVWATNLQTDTGIGISRDQALVQAAERCLRETISILNQGV